MRLSGCSYVNTPLTVVTIQALLKTARKQQWRAKDAYRGSKCSRSEAQVLVEEAAAQSGESRPLCWFITLLGLVTEIRTSMFQSDSWPLRFTHPTGNRPTAAAVFQTHAHLHTGKQTLISVTPTPTRACEQKNWGEHIDRDTHTSTVSTFEHAPAHKHASTKQTWASTHICACVCKERSSPHP